MSKIKLILQASGVSAYIEMVDKSGRSDLLLKARDMYDSWMQQACTEEELLMHQLKHLRATKQGMMKQMLLALKRSRKQQL